MKKKTYLLQQKEDIKFKTKQEFARDVLKGLSKPLKSLPSKYIYDSEGSRLFKEITKLPEYYLTTTEMEILKNNRKQICNKIGNKEFNLIDLGCGDGKKTGVLLQELQKNDCNFYFFPIDISEDAIAEFTDNLKNEFLDLQIRGLVSEYFEGLSWLSSKNNKRNVVLFLGSNIGNFNPIKTKSFLSSLWKSLNNGDLVLIGFDLKKNIDLMTKAYNDKQGITAAFNKNLLKRINSELKGNFDLNQFEFYATYDKTEEAVKSFLISKKKQKVFIQKLNKFFTFKAREPIHTESSYKYHFERIKEMAGNNNFEIVENFFDTNSYFVDSLWKVVK